MQPLLTEKPRDIARRFRLIGESPQLLRAVELAARVAPTNVPVLILGENGTGKEIFAHIIHQLSLRRDKAFLAINCGAIPEGTMDSELFGHERGAFTSAHESRKGYFEVANGGTLFLDEVGEMPLGTQARLLRVLETGEYLRVGSSKVQKTDVRLIAATNRDLLRLIRKGKFREDLFHRLNTITIQVPPLRERTEDIELLFEFFVDEQARQLGAPPIELDSSGLEKLRRYPWPGNVRELKHLVEKLMILHPGQRITEQILQEYLPERDMLLPIISSVRETSSNFRSPEHNTGDGHLYAKVQHIESHLIRIQEHLLVLQEMLRQIGQHVLNADKERLLPPATPPEPETLSLEANERRLIEAALRRFNSNRKKAAQALGISERTLYRKIEEYAIEA
ncbi:MAG: sigma-54 dependent transcriptional regulator [Bacteroidia bacterium]|nr:sigma-54 dependent transcriptional regulator [Bacteroidia bacterium]MCX7651355.1 sigma-54 dependent transcriptional regulator [Bacteroidia bacterium]MDW8416745.1 sigma-54 dependent transcriptional regulator [Bacteroidia bacterium]